MDKIDDWKNNAQQGINMDSAYYRQSVNIVNKIEMSQLKHCLYRTFSGGLKLVHGRVEKLGVRTMLLVLITE